MGLALAAERAFLANFAVALGLGAAAYGVGTEIYHGTVAVHSLQQDYNKQLNLAEVPTDTPEETVHHIELARRAGNQAVSQSMDTGSNEWRGALLGISTLSFSALALRRYKDWRRVA